MLGTPREKLQCKMYSLQLIGKQQGMLHIPGRRMQYFGCPCCKLISTKAGIVDELADKAFCYTLAAKCQYFL